MFNHDTRGGFFSNQDDVTSKNSDNPDAYLFSILDQLESYRGSDGNFTFLVCYPELKWGVDGKVCNEWIQSSNPLTETTITGLKAISLAFTITSYKKAWVGLGKGISQWPYAAIDDSPSQDNWWFAIGSTRKFNGGIPGPRYRNEATHIQMGTVKNVQLYVENPTDRKFLGKRFCF